jgi:hypothetical protein
MPRLIDADALREVLETAVQITPITQQYNKEDVIRAIMDAPTITYGTDSIMIKWTPDIDKLVQDVAFRGLNEFSFLGKSIREWVEIILEQPRWISVKDRTPAETHSIFWRLIGSKQWNNAMWREQSDKVLVAVSFKDGTRFVTTGETHDGEWYTTVSRTLTPEVTHWMQMPEPPEEVTGDARR